MRHLTQSIKFNQQTERVVLDIEVVEIATHGTLSHHLTSRATPFSLEVTALRDAGGL